MITEFAQGSTILVDKPLKWTSFDAVNKLRWHLRQRLGVKKLKVGHAGTLDPLATGLLVICIGKHTKLIEGLTSDSKTYTGTFLLGKTTPSYDLETEFNSEKDTHGITTEQMEEIRMTFLGVQQQVPPLFSAKQIDGKRAYDYARAGIEKELKANTIEIMDFVVDSSRFPEIDFEISCSKGTYIRSIAHDFGQKLGCGATLIALRRTKSGIYDIKDSRTVEEWISFIEEQPL
ncbi:MAG: tRNA pseudouridine synthase [Fluviicola sp.]|jgi:tRNA pseudouridine55 synthase|uniref:tRNA pseudouridine(55) synthase TruB n=1 Tax=Fluviicola sp. TaxID=1917219 RepID=UPI0026217379|nr:tRNA pseudouridine(55) synthase TruB [Fluviicola sp.]MDF3027582.1 tRNA pseudouridine synthase [Fluviicola sp.]